MSQPNDLPPEPRLGGFARLRILMVLLLACDHTPFVSL
jgi:hypothetical protein